ncbi:ParA family protein [Curtobacterium flaccumfaciens pv. oortii]|uniref:ParA family protein n=1 Tax=Curtobacterium flaccumfaciens TaxID=2035 RepID=UPI002659FEB1|nr:ParA family protein [Curtobacterium flaccumfaciens]MCS5524783.1 ParA family protein [Curtobacterium flaccumfaciens pv. oortii]
MLTEQERSHLRRVITCQSNKGGVGKTSISTNEAGVLAEAGYKVLLIDLDPQGDVADDLGYRGTEADDGGAALFNAIAMDQPLVPVKNVRPNLDVVPAGRRTAMLIDHIHGETLRGQDVSETLARRLLDIADQYDVILMDTPPGEGTIQTLALVAARWILIPTQPDDSSLRGISSLADRVVAVRPKNPDLAVLGVVLFPVAKSGTRILADTRTMLESIMGGVAPVFAATIRQAQASGVNARRRGQLAIELARDAEEQEPWYKVLRAAKDAPAEAATAKRGVRIADSANSLAGDYLRLTEEILTTLAAHEQAQAATEAGA